jgi:hypothetical protein
MITQKDKDKGTRTQLKTGDELGYSTCYKLSDKSSMRKEPDCDNKRNISVVICDTYIQ